MGSETQNTRQPLLEAVANGTRRLGLCLDPHRSMFMSTARALLKAECPLEGGEEGDLQFSPLKAD